MPVRAEQSNCNLIPVRRALPPARELKSGSTALTYRNIGFRLRFGCASSGGSCFGRESYSTWVGAPQLAFVPLKLNLDLPLGLGSLVQMGFEHGIAGIADAACGRSSLHYTKVSLFHPAASPLAFEATHDHGPPIPQSNRMPTIYHLW
jgi:hypothetical protein